jgi:hypothetical protein
MSDGICRICNEIMYSNRGLLNLDNDFDKAR